MWAERACMRNGGASPARLFILLSSADSHSTTKEQKHIYLSEIACARSRVGFASTLQRERGFLAQKSYRIKDGVLFVTRALCVYRVTWFGLNWHVENLKRFALRTGIHQHCACSIGKFQMRYTCTSSRLHNYCVKGLTFHFYMYKSCLYLWGEECIWYYQ
jgi:hypothetical protein